MSLNEDGSRVNEGRIVPRDAPLRLKRAAELGFPDGGMTAAGLRREADKGNLDCMRIAGKDFTTIEAIARMMEKCRKEPKVRDSGSAPPTGTTNQFGSSATETNGSALAATLMSARRLKGNSQTTSPKSIGRRGSGDVIPIKSLSPTF
jgi:hypothetical protein